ncbi:MAG: GntR family transcriptional regulator [Novosphingobium sp.]|nr:GntR family transcriptional regulator [Novosphingobium sp.]
MSSFNTSALDIGSMDDQLDPGPVPLYYQLEQRLRARIIANEFVPGNPLPTEDQICSQYKVSRITVRRALESLQRQGLIERRRGVGSFVAEKPKGINSHLTGSLSEFLAMAGTLRTSCLSLEEVDAPADVRSRLQLGASKRVILLRTVGSLEEGPVAYLEIWFPLEIGSKLSPDQLGGNLPVIRLVEQVANIRITRAEQTIEPDHAGEEAGKHLQIDPKTPILNVSRIYFAGNRPIELANVRYHPDRYRYAIEFKG